MSNGKFDRENELTRLKAVAESMAKQLNVQFVLNPDKECRFAAGDGGPVIGKAEPKNG